MIKAKKVTSPDSEADPLPNAGRVALSKKYRTAHNPNCKIGLSLSTPFFYYLCPNLFIIPEDVNYFIYIPLNSIRNNSIVSTADTPKTSEYAFFKRLKKNIGHSNSDLLHRGSNLSKITQPSNCISGGLHFDF